MCSPLQSLRKCKAVEWNFEVSTWIARWLSKSHHTVHCDLAFLLKPLNRDGLVHCVLRSFDELLSCSDVLVSHLSQLGARFLDCQSVSLGCKGMLRSCIDKTVSALHIWKLSIGGGLFAEVAIDELWSLGAVFVDKRLHLTQSSCNIDGVRPSKKNRPVTVRIDLVEGSLKLVHCF